MKKVILLVAALALFAGSAVAGPTAYIGCYTDDIHSNCRQDVLAPYVGFTNWVWVLPSDNGMMCAEFMLQNPAWLLNVGTVVNPEHSVALGDPFTGYSICFAGCQTGWTWLLQLSALPTVAGLQDFVTIVPHPDSGAILVANCIEPDYPLEPLQPLNYLALNTPCETATENASWGAIKNIAGE